jgi:hypothetical protein
LYRVAGNSSRADAGDFGISSFAPCDSGDFPLNGLSFYSNILPGGNATLLLTGTALSTTAEFNMTALPNGYTTNVLRPQPLDLVQSFVTCFDNPPLRP